MTSPTTTPPAATAERFAAAVTASAAGHLAVADLAAVADHVASHGRRVAVAPSYDRRQPALRRELEARGVEVVVAEGDDPAAQVADVDVGIVEGAMGIAETGSVLVSEHPLGDRVTSMLCHRLVLVVPRDRLTDRLESAATWLAGRPAGVAAFAALITGPSRTADIERSLTIGVQGPQEVDVVVLG
ncbi:MAG TPA: LUD domain-containing protein [Egicoccus sp.]|nr:LUD domain-containing protein [Egicoccus sp.]HSK25109.1 LUD domain-containing protein [Egicoccus sp.]